MSSRRIPRKVAPVQELGTSFYAKLVGVSFTVGACMEGFMIKTGFFEKAKQLEAERREALAEPPAWVAALQQKKAREDGTRN
jgi:hypothetical protein